jgi:hypothetical protein
MSKKSRTSRTNHQNTFPFHMLMYWVKPYTSGPDCQCGQASCYAVESFLPIRRWPSLTALGRTNAEAIDIIWDEALSQQRQDRYKVEPLYSACEQCCVSFVSDCVGEHTARVIMLPLLLFGDVSSVVIGTEVVSPSHDGKNFATVVHAQNLEELVTATKGKVVHINLAK